MYGAGCRLAARCTLLLTGLIGRIIRGYQANAPSSQSASHRLLGERSLRIKLHAIALHAHDGSVVRGDGSSVRFVVTDGGAELPVVFAGILPDLFREGQGVITTGKLEGGVFVASEVLARHDESYMPKEVADALREQGMLHFGEGIAPIPDS